MPLIPEHEKEARKDNLAEEQPLYKIIQNGHGGESFLFFDYARIDVLDYNDNIVIKNFVNPMKGQTKIIKLPEYTYHIRRLTPNEFRDV